ALKFTPEGGSVQVLLAMTADTVEMTVSDTGIGIKADFLPHVFDRFSQADTSMTRRFQGLGIGLALVRNLVELQGGAVRVRSGGEGQGAAFVVQLRRLQAHEHPCQPPASQPPRRRLAGVKVLLLDDDADA
ncbi:ATP-binding protein, partial [Salmonella enterica subsp. enterica serovar Typhimurium]|nr:ATP-binding protein [Salmonella enterica subsp. enterica serovar Typhimurium]